MTKRHSILLMIFICMGCNSAPKDAPISDAADDEITEEYIIGGHTVTKKSEIAATTVSLLDIQKGTLCTASVLSESVAISAAHCVDGNPHYMQLSFGPRSMGHEVRPVEEVEVSPNWSDHQNDEVNTGDISLIRFSGGLPTGVHPVALMSSTHRLTNGEIVTLAGFGISNGVSGSGAGRLRTVDIKIANAKYSATEVMLDQTAGKGACHGDSGGPAFVQDNNGGLLLWGVTSRGVHDPTDSCSGDSIYTRIQPYSHWINATVRSWKK